MNDASSRGCQEAVSGRNSIASDSSELQEPRDTSTASIDFVYCALSLGTEEAHHAKHFPARDLT